MSPHLKVLCVDDDLDTAESTADLLSLAGCEAVACRNGVAALAVAQQFQPAVCVIDLTMPGMDGDDLARPLRGWAVGPGVRLIALTGRRDDVAQDRLCNAGFETRFVKPADPDRLVEAVIGRFSNSGVSN